jgi:predicted porin
MKKSLLALAALTAFAGAASAQSSVTLFGIVDLNLRNQDNGSAGSRKTMSQDGNASTRLGFRGVEDLGGGLRAGFWIEGAMNPDVGTSAGQSWQRRSTVSLMGNFGEIRLGRDYTASFWNQTVFDVFGTNGVGSAINGYSTLGSGATTQVRANNMVGYFLPAMGGLYGQVQVAAGEAVAGNKYKGARIGYSAGPLNVAGAYGVTDIGAAPDFKDMNFGISFNAGFATIYGQYGKQDFGAANQKRLYVGAGVPLGAATLKASYAKFDGTSSSLDADQIAVGVVYDLSKRTAVYAHYSRMDNDGNAATGARFVTSGSGPAFTRGGETSTGYEFGLRHSF